MRVTGNVSRLWRAGVKGAKREWRLFLSIPVLGRARRHIKRAYKRYVVQASHRATRRAKSWFKRAGRKLDRVARKVVLWPWARLWKIKRLRPYVKPLAKFSHEHHRIVAGSLAGLFILGMITPIWQSYWEAQRYRVSAAAQSILEQPNPNVTKKLQYNPRSDVFAFNADAKKSVAPGENPVEQLKQQVGGGGADDEQLYSADISRNLQKGVTYYENQMGLSFTLKPQFSALFGKDVNGRLVYPLNGVNGQLIYTVQPGGLKEDIVLYEHPGTDKITANYKLELPKSLEAKLLDTGEIGLYSADPVLFGQISYGSSDDAARVEKARNESPKTHLAMKIPAPVVFGTDGKRLSGVQSSFSLSGDTLTVTTSGLDDAEYPLSIDPSIIVDSASGWRSGNLESNAEVEGDELRRGSLTGGGIARGSVVASGGDNVYEQGNYRYHEFTSSGTLTVGVGGDVEYLIVGGGGGGGGTGSSTSAGGGGGAGGVLSDTTTVTQNDYSIVVGGGGSGGNNTPTSGQDGSDSSFAGVTATGGGGGGAYSTAGSSGGSGGGGGAGGGAVSGGSGTAGQGNDGGDALNVGLNRGAGGGGGATAAGSDGADSDGGDGGDGISVWDGLYQVGGGGGGGSAFTAASSGGLGGGGDGANDDEGGPNDAVATAGTANTGGGGGGGAGGSTGFQSGADGGSGIVVVRYPIKDIMDTASLDTPVHDHATVTRNGYMYAIGGTDNGGAASTVTRTGSVGRIDSGSNSSSQGITVPADAEIIVVGAAGWENDSSYFTGGSVTLGGQSLTISPNVAADPNDSMMSALWYQANPSTGSQTLAWNWDGFGSPDDGISLFYAFYKGVDTSNPIRSSDLGIGSESASVGPMSAQSGDAAVAVSSNFGGSDNTVWTGATELHDGEFTTDATPSFAEAFPTDDVTITASVSSGVSMGLSGIVLRAYEPPPTVRDIVQYAAINPDGTLGSWSTTTNLPAARTGLSAVTYNDYVYVFGGSSDGSAVSDVAYYAEINDNGTIGSWGTTTSIPTARTNHASVAYDGYVYVLGGYHPTASTDCSTTSDVLCDDLQYAPVKADGSLGGWTSATDLPSKRMNLEAAVYNGHIYLSGGVDNHSTGNVVDAVHFASIDTDGSIGTWTSTTSFADARALHGMTIANGYVYIHGGYDEGLAALGDLQYAPVYASGRIGTWTSAGTSAATCGHDLVHNAGQLYFVGGGNRCDLGAAPEVAGFTTGGRNNGGSFTVNLPANSDGYLAITGVTDGNAVTPPSGWTLVEVDAADSDWNRFAVYTANTDDSPGTSWTASGDSGTYTSVVIAGYEDSVGVHAEGYEKNGNSSEDNPPGPLPSAPSITTTETALIVRVLTANTWDLSGYSVGFPADSEDTQTYRQSGGDSNSVLYASALQGAAGSTGTADFTISGASYYAGVAGTIALTKEGGGLGAATDARDKITVAAISQAGAVAGSAVVEATGGDNVYEQGGYRYHEFTSSGTFTISWGGEVEYLIVGGGGGGGGADNNVRASGGGAGGEVLASSDTLAVDSYSVTVGGGGAGGVGGAYGSNGGTSSFNSETVDGGGGGGVGQNGPENGLSGGSGGGGGGESGSGGAATATLPGLGNAGGDAAGGLARGGGGGGGAGSAGSNAPAENTGGAGGSGASIWSGTYVVGAGGGGGGSASGGAGGSGGGGDGVTDDVTGESGTANTGGGGGGTYGDGPSGNDGTGGDGGSGVVVVRYPLSSSGEYTGQSTSTTRRRAPVVVENGYVYVISGRGASTLTTDVSYAPINADGTLGSWTSATNSISGGRQYHAAAVYNGYMYVAGGDIGGTQQSDVQYAPIESDGDLDSWSSTTSLSASPAAREHLQLEAYNGYLYAIGGLNGGSRLDIVEYAPINSNGTIGSWSSTTSLPNDRAQHEVIMHDGYAYVIGGDESNGTQHVDTVYHAPINSNGTIGSWSSTASLTEAKRDIRAFVYNGHMYVTGGENSSSVVLNAVEYAPINADGTLGTWEVTDGFGTARYQHGAFGYNGNLYVYGGEDGSSTFDTVEFARINNGGSGTAASYSSTTSIGVATNRHGTAVYNGYVYILGGSASGGSADIDDVWYAPLDADGTIGTWTEDTSSSLPTNLTQLGAVAHDGYLYVIGGDTSSGPTDEVWYAPINSDGTIGTWTEDTDSSLPNTRRSGTATVYDGRVYVSGGVGSGGTYNDVLFASFNPDGSLGTWDSSSTDFTTARRSHQMVVYNGYMYIIGGFVSGSTYLRDVQYGAIEADGSIDSWSYTTALPEITGGHGAAAANGYLYITGGIRGPTNGRSEKTNLVSINPNGTLGQWQETEELATARNQHSTIIQNGYLYVLGGQVSGGGSTSSTESAPLHVQGRKAVYSKQFDIDTKVHLKNVVLNGFRADETEVYVRTAGPDGVYGAAENLDDMTFSTGTPGVCLVDQASSPYVRVTVVFDDAGQAVFADSSGLDSRLTSLTVEAQPDRAPPDKRLRHGGWFANDGVQQPFDTCGTAVREFDGTDDDIVTSTGALSGMTYGTVAAVFKLDPDSTYRTLLGMHDSGGTELGAIGIGIQDEPYWFSDGAGGISETGAISENTWYLMVVRKASTSQLPRFSFYNFSTGSWSHSNSDNSHANWTAPGASGDIRFSRGSQPDMFSGRIAARAAWSNSLGPSGTWTADASGDSAIESAGLEKLLSNWQSASPDALWAFNQGSVGEPVTDLTGNGADQTSITGTTVVDDVPPGFGFGN